METIWFCLVAGMIVAYVMLDGFDIGAGIHAGEFGALADPLLREVFQSGVTEAGAHEGTVWLVDEAGEFLLPAINTGPRAGEMIGRFRQPLKSGLICMVFAFFRRMASRVSMSGG